MSLRRGLIPGVALALLAIIATLAVAEAALRAFTPEGFPERPFPNTDILRVDPVLGWRTALNLDVTEVEIGRVRYSARLRTDARGFRRSGEAEPAAPATVRIVCVGDSGTFGLYFSESLAHPTPDAVHFHGYVEELRVALAAQGSRHVEVLNAGVIGYSTSHALRQFVTSILDLDPDVVTVRLGYNDHALAWAPALRPSDPTSPSIRWLLQHGHRWKLMRIALAIEQGIPWLHPKPRSIRWANLPEFERNLRRMAAVAREHRLRLLFLDYPLAPVHTAEVRDLDMFAGLAGAPSARELYTEHATYQASLRRIGRIEGVPVVESGPDLWASPRAFTRSDPVHPTAEGARLIAIRVLRALQDLGWLEAAEGRASGPS